MNAKTEQYIQFKRRIRKVKLAIAFATCVIGCMSSQYANAADLTADTSNQATVNGYIRSFNWTNHNFYYSGTDNNTFTIGGALHAETKKYSGFSAGGTFYTAQAPFNSSSNIDPTLGKNINTVGEAYGDYKNSMVDIKVGRQSLDTPFANGADYRMIPALYGGVTAVIKPSDNVSITVDRINYFEGWAQSGFSETNGYTSGPFAQANTFTTPGFLTVGVKDTLTLSTLKLDSQAWYYRFYGIANLGFLDEKISMTSGKTFNPFFGMQLVNENSSGSALLGSVNSQLMGAIAGVTFSNGSVSAGAVHIPHNSNAVNNGGMISPYTHIFGSAALYTQNLLFATEDQGSGNAYILHGDYKFTPQISGWAAFNQFNMQSGIASSPTIREYTVSASYAFSNIKGLNLTNMFARAVQFSQTFWQDRLMLQYDL